MNDSHLHNLKRLAQALACARRMQGNTGDNPSVGCIVEDKFKNIVGIGATGINGFPHAEVTALKQAGAKTVGGTLYVTLEPCCHFGKTPPCVTKIINSKIKHVIVGCIDSDKRINGAGIQALLKANITVTSNLPAKDILKHHKGYLLNRGFSRPRFILKMGVSADAKSHSDINNLATRCIITSETSRLFVHHLRSRYDAVMVGSNTIRHDNPMLTCRLKTLKNNIETPKSFDTQIIVLDRNLDLYNEYKKNQNINIFMQSQHKKIFLVHDQSIQIANSADKFNDEQNNTQKPEIVFLPVKVKDNYLDLVQLAKLLANLGVNDILVEGGAELASRLIEAKLLDKCIFIFSPIFFGANGLPSIANINKVSNNWSYGSTRRLGKDLMLDMNIEY